MKTVETVMRTGQLDRVVQYLHRVARHQEFAGLTDGQLVRRYAGQRDQAAFAELVRRHGGMVLGVCGRLLRNRHDAEDAFQAVFLVLAKKAASLRSPEQVGNWLYGVARRAAWEAKKAAAKRRTKEAQAMVRTEAADDSRQELREVLDQELARLPEKYRTAIVLCDLEGNTRKEAARRLGWAEGTVASRQARGRRLLAARLARRGLPVWAGSLALALSETTASALVPTSLYVSILKAASLLAAGKTAAGISAPVVLLMKGVLKAMLLNQLQKIAAVMFVLVLLFLGSGTILRSSSADEPKIAWVPVALPRPTRVKWEYKALIPHDIMDLADKKSKDQFTDGLNRLGLDGWELVTVSPEHGSTWATSNVPVVSPAPAGATAVGTGRMLYVFKRARE